MKYRDRINALYKWMRSNNIDAAVIEDAENRRNSSLRYFCGMPSDALLFLFADGSSLLLPWDMILAEKLACADRIISYSDYQRNPVKAIAEICNERDGIRRVELTDGTPHLLYSEISETVSGVEVICRSNGLSDFIRNMRSVKDEHEIAIYREAGKLTDELIDAIRGGFENGTIQTETDVAMLIETESRRLGAEGPGFETLAAGADRSWGIHAYPAFSDGPIGGKASGMDGGLSIIDCGLRYRGYITDITITVCRGKLSPRQRDMAELVREAARIGAEACGKGSSASSAAAAVNRFFDENDWEMPHSLGHGIGLDVHEAPILKHNEIYDRPLRPGMIFTIEPGLYDAAAGGVRLENDFLMTENGAVPLTSSRILTLP